MRVLVIGLAETGVAVARVLRREGHDVTVAEDAPTGERYLARAAEVRAIGATLVEAPDDASARALVAAADLVVPSPLVAPGHVMVRSARERGIPVRSEIDLAGERARVPLVAVTGTNGKTTVTSMIAAMLVASGRRASAVGNIGRPLIDAVGDDVEVLVAEVSSFQLAFAETFRPEVAVLLAVTPDHLDWHGSFEEYARAKARITEHQRPDDMLVYDADDTVASAIAARSPARTLCVTLRADASNCARVQAGALIDAESREIAPLDAMRRALLHDRTNALAASVAALAAGASSEGVRATLTSYATMPHRVALVGEAIGVQWYDDSKATNPDATLRAVGSFESVVLLAGGRNKGLDLSVLASQARRLRAVIAFGEAAPEIVAAFESVDGPTVVSARSMRDAVVAANEIAQAGDVVLLSPACASFDAYTGYAERGDDFAREVRQLLDTEACW
jgi:UDP-N-acetylmuramoylalanine--D-glutamate ligase